MPEHVGNVVSLNRRGIEVSNARIKRRLDPGRLIGRCAVNHRTGGRPTPEPNRRDLDPGSAERPLFHADEDTT